MENADGLKTERLFFSWRDAWSDLLFGQQIMDLRLMKFAQMVLNFDKMSRKSTMTYKMLMGSEQNA